MIIEIGDTVSRTEMNFASCQVLFLRVTAIFVRYRAPSMLSLPLHGQTDTYPQCS
jgi:hypothetical protein